MGMLSFKLLYRAFEWCSNEHLLELQEHILEIPDDSDIGYTLKVKCLEYPKELHDINDIYIMIINFSLFMRVLKMKISSHIKEN